MLWNKKFTTFALSLLKDIEKVAILTTTEFATE